MLEILFSLFTSVLMGTVDQQWFVALIAVSVVFGAVIFIKTLVGWRC